MRPDQIERYKRHIFLREIGGPGQTKLRNARVFVAGAGGLGAPVIQYLAACGIGHLTIADMDAVDLSNLQRQIIYRTHDIGEAKVALAKEFVSRLNPDVSVNPIDEPITRNNIHKSIAGHDLVLDGTDNFPTRRLINRACVEAGIPLLSGAISQWEGQVSLFDVKEGTPCFDCLFPNDPAAGIAPNCSEGGVIGALPGIVGTIMALEAIKFLSGAGQCLKGEILIYDGLWAESRKIRVKRSANCAVCTIVQERAACLA